jgi:translation initiation factor IF-2
MNETTVTQPDKPKVNIPQIVGVGEYAQKLGLPVTRVIGELMKNGVMATINEQIDFDTAAIIGSDLGFEVQPEAAPEPEEAPAKVKLPKGEGETRPPVVTVMGHVDHGKTSLLDAIRQADVVSGEAGAITQHIGAYQIKRKERWITFLDTPGHEAFSALRAHGARMTDVAVIVVAADDGVKPQTKEAVKMAQQAGVQLVVAINKVDKAGADTNRVKQELSELGLVPEDWGGKTVTVEVSAKTGDGIEQLLDLVLLVVDLEDLRARSQGPVSGVIVESHLDSGRGPVVTVLIREGCLQVGDYLVAGRTYGKVRSLEDFRGKRIKQAMPGMPAVVTGLKAVPDFGDSFEAVKSEKEARDLAVSRQRSDSIKSMVRVKKIDASEIASAITAGKVSDLNVIVKADVQGSLESLLGSLAELRNEEVAVKVVQSGLGDIRESDVSLAKTTGALILGFNTQISSAVKQLATREQVKVQLYKVIYELLDDLRDVLSQMMRPETVETVVAELEVLGVFKVAKGSVICGGRVTMGKLEPKLEAKVFRAGKEIGRATVSNLQKGKQEAKAAFEGDECGMNLDTNSSVEVGDKLEFFTTETRSRHFEG